MTRGRARRYLLTKSDESYYPQVVADAGYDVWDWSTLNAGTLFQDSAKTTPASANGDVIGCWTDGVGGVDATQATTANKPGLATGSLNGLPTLSFDGGDLLATANITIGTFAVWLVTAITNTNSAPLHRGGAADQIFNNGSDNIRITVIRSATTSQKTATGATTNSYQILRHQFDGTHALHLLYSNNALVTMADTTVNDPGTATVTQPLYIGAANTSLYITGNIAHLCIVSPYPTDASIIVNMENYINGIWSVY